MDSSHKSAKSPDQMSLRIEGMHCASCVATIEKSLLSQDGVIRASVNLLDEKATIEYDSSRVDRAKLESAVEASGYRPRRSTMTLTLDSSPTEDKWSEIESVVGSIHGVITAKGVRGRSILLLEIDELLVKQGAVRRTLSSLGFGITEGVSSECRESLSRSKEIKYYRNLFLLSLILTIPTTLIMFEVLTPFLPSSIDPRILMLILVTPIQFIGGYPFYKASLRGLAHGKTNMDTLIMLGTSAAYFYSVYATFFLTGYMVFFDTSAMLISFILVGRWLEASAKGRTSNAIIALMDLQPSTAIVLRDHGEIAIAAEDVEVNDIVLVKPGGRIPVDGIVLEGQSTVDESMISGESIPVAKTIGDEVIGATINKNGVLRIRATRVGSETTLSQIIKLVEDAQTQKPQIQRKADAIAEVFVPLVLIISLATFLAWFIFGGGSWETSLRFTIAVLVAACPCALGLATPTAVAVGLGKGAQNGLLIKTGSGLETVPEVDTVVFDKTGTLTVGSPSVTDFLPASGHNLKNALLLIASLERLSEHPLAEAIIEYAKEKELQLLEVDNFTSIPGFGIRGIISGSQILVGNLRLLENEQIQIGEFAEHIGMLEDQGKTLVFASIDGKPLALIAIADEIKKSAKPVVSHLMNSRIDVWMITGDRDRTAHAVAEAIGIHNVLSQVLPGDKANKVRELQEQNRTVAFVGDGINDSPALAQADVGIALGSGTQVSVEAGDIVLVRDDLTDVVSAMELGKVTVSKIRQGFFWALIYNLVLLPIAAGVLFPFTGLALRPEFAGLAMALSSVSVVTNALSLNRFTPSQIKTIPERNESVHDNIAVDPICKMDVDISTATLMSKYQDRMYYFCNPYCKDTFDKNPEEYKGQDIRM